MSLADSEVGEIPVVMTQVEAGAMIGGRLNPDPASRRRLGIYATIGVPEIWRFDGSTIAILHKQPDGEYAEVQHSPIFSFVRGVDLVGFLRQGEQLDENKLMRAFRAWVREKISQVP